MRTIDQLLAKRGFNAFEAKEMRHLAAERVPRSRRQWAKDVAWSTLAMGTPLALLIGLPLAPSTESGADLALMLGAVWLSLNVFMLVPALYVATLIQRRRVRRAALRLAEEHPGLLLCAGCGYDLQPTADQARACPECGMLVSRRTRSERALGGLHLTEEQLHMFAKVSCPGLDLSFDDLEGIVVEAGRDGLLRAPWLLRVLQSQIGTLVVVGMAVGAMFVGIRIFPDRHVVVVALVLGLGVAIFVLSFILQFRWSWRLNAQLVSRVRSELRRRGHPICVRCGHSSAEGPPFAGRCASCGADMVPPGT
ncbi:MAG: hypothetical protein KDA22_13010 [Phycisphaerales bacterium]|nr:hypothetical protein [Phycisphaerales bacterium]